MPEITKIPKMPYSYLIKKDGDYTIAYDKYGNEKYSRTDASTVIQEAIDALSVDGTIFIEGGAWGSEMQLTNTIDIGSAHNGVAGRGLKIIIDGTIYINHGNEAFRFWGTKFVKFCAQVIRVKANYPNAVFRFDDCVSNRIDVGYIYFPTPYNASSKAAYLYSEHASVFGYVGWNEIKIHEILGSKIAIHAYSDAHNYQVHSNKIEFGWLNFAEASTTAIKMYNKGVGNKIYGGVIHLDSSLASQIGIDTSDSDLHVFGVDIRAGNATDLAYQNSGRLFLHGCSFPISKTSNAATVVFDDCFDNEVYKLFKNSGTATILNTGVSVTFAHGLARTPTLVTLGATHAEVADAVWSADATNITITVPSAVTANRNISWYVE